MLEATQKTNVWTTKGQTRHRNMAKRMLLKVKELMIRVNYGKCRNRTTQVRRSI